MKKNKFIKSTLILILGGFITKILGMLIKIVITRALGTEGIGRGTPPERPEREAGSRQESQRGGRGEASCR